MALGGQKSVSCFLKIEQSDVSHFFERLMRTYRRPVSENLGEICNLVSDKRSHVFQKSVLWIYPEELHWPTSDFKTSFSFFSKLNSQIPLIFWRVNWEPRAAPFPIFRGICNSILEIRSHLIKKCLFWQFAKVIWPWVVKKFLTVFLKIEQSDVSHFLKDWWGPIGGLYLQFWEKSVI